jgi:tripartite-type tricarboxylate transporter receptor subunit TctC
MIRKSSRLMGALSLMAALSVTTALSAAESAEEFYKKNNVVTIFVGFGPGTGYETWARLVGQYMGKYMVGKPTFVVKTMPGAGSLTMANHLANQAPKDGSTFGTFSRNLPVQVLMGMDNARFDPRELDYIGSPERQPTVVCGSMQESGVLTMEDLQKKELTVGGTGVATGPSFLPLIINNVAGTKFKVIDGYQSTSEVYLAMQRGEVGGVCQGLLPLIGSNQDLMKANRLKILFNFEEKRDPSIPNVPSIFEYIKNPENRQIMEFINASPAMGRPFAAPKGIPSDRLAALRRAFDQAVKDPDFAKDTAKVQLEAGLVPGAELAGLMKGLFEFPRAIVDKANAMLPKEGG